MARVYVDTNVLLDFYQSAHDPLGVFTELIDRAKRIIITEQTLAEVKRNRAQRLSALIGDFRKTSAVHPHTTSLIKALDEWKSLIDARDAFHKQAARVQKRLKSFLDDPGTDPVYTKFLELVNSEGVKTVRTSNALVERAHRRKLLGNPPSSPDKYTIGDELIWESLLEGCGEDLIIVSRDKTFADHETILREEYEQWTGKKLLGVHKMLASALNQVGAESPLIEEEDSRWPWESPWEADARESLEAALNTLEFDYDAKVIRVLSYGDEERRGGGGGYIISSLAEFDEWASEKAFDGYNNSAPRDSGDWVFEFDEPAWIGFAHGHFEEELRKLGWM